MVDSSPGFFDLDGRLAELSAKGDDLERVRGLVDFEMFRPALEAAVPRADRSKVAGRPSINADVQGDDPSGDARAVGRAHRVPQSRTGCPSCASSGWDWPMRFPTPTRSGRSAEGAEEADAIYGLFRRFDEALRSEGFLAMSGQIVDATIVACFPQTAQHDPRRRGDQGRPIPADWKDKPAKLAREGSGRALDGQILQGEAARGSGWKCAGGRPRDPGVRLQEPRLDRSGLRPDPQLDDDARRGARRGAARGAFWTGRTRRATSGRTRPTARRRTKRCSRGMGSCRASIARSRRAGQCLSACVSPTRRNPKSAARSSTCLRIRKDRWASSCARSAWRALT